MLISVSSLFLYMLLQPVFGLLSDKIGRRPVLMGFGVLGTLCTVPLLTALTHTKDAFIAFLLVMAGLIIVSGGAALRADGVPVRRHGRVRGHMAQAAGPRAVVLLVRDGLHPLLAARIHADAGHAGAPPLRVRPSQARAHRVRVGGARLHPGEETCTIGCHGDSLR